MSGAADAESRGCTLGAVATLTKPIDFDVLLDIVRRYCCPDAQGLADTAL
jgi:hypothetical protein